MDVLKSTGAAFLCLAVSIGFLMPVASAVAQSAKTYDSFSKEDHARFRSMMKDSGYTNFRLCEFDQICEGGRCAATTRSGEIATKAISASEVFDDLGEPNVITATWIGPEGRTDTAGATINGVLTVFGGGYGDRVSVLSFDKGTGNARLTLHGTQDLWARTYSGICEEIE
ncbi:MAG: hypothetical protein AAGA94_03135 [Pseudomonadota bacterium]